MTNTPEPGNEPEPTSENQPQQASPRVLRQRQRRRIGLLIGAGLLVGVGGGITWAWFFIEQQLGPTVEQTLTKILNRPVKLGQVERFSLNGLRFGSTKVPATPTDPDRADIEAVDVSFNLVPLLLQRTLPLEVTLVKPNAYIEQSKDGAWVNTKLQTLPKGAIDIKLQVLRLQNADVVLVPRGGGGNPKTPVAVKVPSGKARFLNDNKLIQFDLGGQLVSGGNFTIKGESRPSEGRTNLAVSGTSLGAAEVGRLIQLPILLQAGKLAANLELKQEPAVPLKLSGAATLDQVTARVPQLPKPFVKTNGLLRFKGTQVRLENIKTIFGQVPAQANGIVDTQSGFNLSARTQPIALSQVLQTFNIKKLPIVASGEVQAALRLTGALNKPIVSGDFATTKPTQLDRVNFRTISSGFSIIDSTLAINNLRAIPTVGGLVTGRGQVQLGQKGNVRFDAQATGVPGDAIARTYGLKLPVPIGSVSGSTQIITSLDNPQNFRASGNGIVNVAGGTVTASNVQVASGRFQAQVRAEGVQVQRLAQVPSQLQGPLSGSFNVSGPLATLSASTIRGSGSGRLNIAGGTVRATDVELANGRFDARVEADGVQVERLAQVPPALRGPVSGRFNVSGSLTALTPSTIRATGSGRLNIAGGTVRATDVQLANGRFDARVEADGVQVERLAQVPPALRGPLSGRFDVSGSLTTLSPAAISGRGSGSLDVAGGTVTATNVILENGRFRVQGRAEGVQVQRLAQVPPQLQGPLPLFGSFELSGNLASLSPSTITGSASGSLDVAGGTITARNLSLENGRFRVQGRAEGVQVQRLAQVPPQLQGPLSGNFELSGNLASLSPSTITGSASGSLNVAGGTVTATNVRLDNGRFQAVVEPTGVQLANFSQNLRGSLGGRLNVSGSLTALSPSAIQASGQVNFSEGLALIDRPLTASINWNGQQLQILQARANGFNADGVVNVNLANQGLQAIRSFNLNVQARDLNLQQLPVTLPNTARIAGRADFDGRIAGTPTAPSANGNLQLRDFVAGGLAFEPLLKGSVNAAPGQGVNLQLAGNTDQIQVALGSDYKPISFVIQRGEAVARGSRQGELLLVNAQKFPISLLKNLTPLPSAIASQPLSGDLSGDLAVNLNTYGISGTVAIANPIFGTLRGDSFTGSLQYENGIVSLRDGQFKQGDNQYLLSAQLTPTPRGPQFQAQLQVAQGDLKDVLTALQLFDFTDLNRGFKAPIYQKAGNIAITPAGLPEAPLEIQLRRLAEIQALLQQQREQRAASPFPELADAKGRFTGTLNVAGSPASGISADFNIQGQDWQWGAYSANQVNAQGNFQNGVLTLLPLRFQSGESLLSYAGTIGGDAQSGQLQIRNLPIDELQAVLQKVTKVPPALVGFTGLLNATATLSGSIKNPQARGEVIITDATLNQTPLQSAQGSFSYANARLNFDSSLLLAETSDPLTINGSVPYKLPIASVDPASNQINLNINVQNQGLALLNLFTNGQVSWVDGTGNVQLEISGIYDQKRNRPGELVAKGIATVDNATLAARALPEGDRLTNVSSRIRFDFDRILVESARAQFSDGIITAAGTIPISQPAPQENPLTIDIGALAINLKGLYRGRVRGNVVIGGAALAPRIAGKLNLFDGQVSLAEQTPAPAIGGDGSTGGEQASTSPIEFNGLDLTLGKGIQITRVPILNFLASGTLTINGRLGNLSPEGTIRLERGEVNLFTTQFRLVRNYENTARFVPQQGLDPTLDVRLQALVTESTQRRLPNDPLSAEIREGLNTDLTFGRVRTVRVQARAMGLASRLADNLELTSTPSRSKSEIVALLGGSFVDTLGRGDSTLGLANLAGSALLSNVQNIIGDALGLSEFRLFPTIITNEDKRASARSSSSLGLSAEAGVDISRNFSVSVLKELTTNQPFQYSLRYRVNEQTLLRGFSDFSGNTGAIVEYERRF